MNLWFDIKYASRLVFKFPGQSLICVVVVALSVGMAVWSYALADGIAFKRLPFAGSDRWYSVQISPNATATPLPAIDAYTYQELIKRTRSVNYIGAYATKTGILSEGQQSISLQASLISPSLLTAMQVRPHMGRLFSTSDSETNAAKVVLLSYETWKNYFGADPVIVGKQARIDGQQKQIIGVMPKTPLAFAQAAFWSPLQATNLTQPGDSQLVVAPFIVLGKGQSIDEISREMQSIVADINRTHPQLFNAARHVAIFHANRMDTHQLLPVVATVNFLAAAILLLGCVNISLLFLARLLDRRRELALRTALGASRWRLLCQCLLESCFLVLPGMSIGIFIAALGLRWGQSIAEFGDRIIPTARAGSPGGIKIHAEEVLAAVIAAAVLWLLSTLIPAWRIAKQDPVVALSSGGKGVTSGGGNKSVGILVGVQVIVSCLVLVVCASIVNAVTEEVSKPRGLATAHVVIATFPTNLDGQYTQDSERTRYFSELTSELRMKAPGVKIAYASAIPSVPNKMDMAIEGQESAASPVDTRISTAVVSDSYFDLLGIKLLAGRLFDTSDSSASFNAAVIDENSARRYWPSEAKLNDVIGKRIRLNPAENGPWLTIVGVVTHVARPYDSHLGVTYQSLRQAPPTAFHLIARLPALANDGKAAVRAAAFAVDRDVPIHNLQTLDDYFQAFDLAFLSLVPVFSVISSITVILAATGLFGLISRSVAQRTQEVGIRRALGGTQWQVTSLFLRQGIMYLVVAVLGGCFGVVIANLLSSSIPNILHRIAPVVLGVFFAMATVIFTASYLPTRRAVALEPGDALRYE